MIKVTIHGILGRMGDAITDVLLADPQISLMGGLDTRETTYRDQFPVFNDPAKLLPAADVVIDFSSGTGATAIAEACMSQGKSLITGTTGLSESQQAKIRALSQKTAVVQAFNFSIGINLMIKLLKTAAQVLKKDFDIEITDIHHRHKKDAPSGTALLLARTLAEALGLQEKNSLQYGRSGDQLTRDQEIAIHSLRGGSVIGEHQVFFLGENENIQFTHQALSRKIFADGVLRAVHWIQTQPPGYYTMQDVLQP